MFDNDTNWIHGNEPVEERLNIAREIKLFQKDPATPFLEKLNRQNVNVFQIDEVSRYQLAYLNYYLSLERYISEMSVARRWSFSTKYARAYSDWDKNVAQKYHKIKYYLELDFLNCLIHAKILCDRSVGLSRLFLKLKNKIDFQFILLAISQFCIFLGFLPRQH